MTEERFSSSNAWDGPWQEDWEHEVLMNDHYFRTTELLAQQYGYGSHLFSNSERRIPLTVTFLEDLHAASDQILIDELSPSMGKPVIDVMDEPAPDLHKELNFLLSKGITSTRLTATGIGILLQEIDDHLAKESALELETGMANNQTDSSDCEDYQMQNRATALVSLGRPEEATRQVSHLQERSLKSDDIVPRLRGDIYRERGDLSKALRYYDKAARTADLPDKPIALARGAEIHVMEANLPAAKDWLRLLLFTVNAIMALPREKVCLATHYKYGDTYLTLNSIKMWLSLSIELTHQLSKQEVNIDYFSQQIQEARALYEQHREYGL